MTQEEHFTEQVLESVERIQTLVGKPFVDKSIGPIIGTFLFSPIGAAIGGAIGTGAASNNASDSLTEEEKNQIENALETAKEELFELVSKSSTATPEALRLKKSIREVLCPPLLRASDDVFEIAKVSTPVLLSLSLAGTISLPAQPMLFAAAAVLLARSSVTAICKSE